MPQSTAALPRRDSACPSSRAFRVLSPRVRSPSAGGDLPMTYLATSAMQVACAALCMATHLGAQSYRPARGELARAIGDSVSRILAAAVRDSAFPGAYAIV